MYSDFSNKNAQYVHVYKDWKSMRKNKISLL